MTNIETLIATTFATAAAESRLAAADAAFVATFVALTGEAQARCWRGLDSGAKFRLVARRIEDMGMSWMPSVVEEYIAKYDRRFALGPVEAAVEGALERLAIEHANAARLADRLGDKAHRKAERAAATAFTNALVQYKAGVRPELLRSGARLIPSSTPGKPAHLLTMDGDWVCNCAAGANMHWPLALVIALEGANDDMERYDDGDVEDAGDEGGGATMLDAQIAAMDAITAQLVERLDPPGDNPLGDEEGDTVPSYRPIGTRIAEARRSYAYAA